MDAIFGTAAHITWYQECARAAVTFVYGLVLVRVAGRRIFGKWSALDIIVSIIIGSNLSRALTGSAALGGTLVATTALVALHWVLAHLVARSRALSRVIEGSAIDLARGGDLFTAMLQRHSVSAADLNEALRQAGVQEVSATQRITLEPSGKITVLK